MTRLVVVGLCFCLCIHIVIQSGMTICSLTRRAARSWRVTILGKWGRGGYSECDTHKPNKQTHKFEDIVHRRLCRELVLLTAKKHTHARTACWFYLNSCIPSAGWKLLYIVPRIRWMFVEAVYQSGDSYAHESSSYATRSTIIRTIRTQNTQQTETWRDDEANSSTQERDPQQRLVLSVRVCVYARWRVLGHLVACTLEDIVRLYIVVLWYDSDVHEHSAHYI